MYLMQHKSKAFEKFKKFRAEVEKQLDTHIRPFDQIEVTSRGVKRAGLARPSPRPTQFLARPDMSGSGWTLPPPSTARLESPPPKPDFFALFFHFSCVHEA